MQQYSVQVETPSPVSRKLTIKVAAQTIASRIQSGLVEVQKTANLKGFRPGHVPINVVKQFYGEDVKHRVFHNVIDEFYRIAVRDQKLRAVGRPAIETPEHQHGAGEHDHSIDEGKDLTFTATIEVIPEVEVKGYTGIALSREKTDIAEADVEVVVKNLLDAHADLVPAGGGLALPDGTTSSRPVQMGDFVDMAFEGGVVTETGVEKKDGMSGSRVIEIGSKSLIDGFEENLVGLRRGEKKTFRLKFPKDYHDASLSEKEAEFSVSINEVKEKKLPELNDEFAKEAGYEDLKDLRAKAREHLTQQKTQDSERKLRSDLFKALIEKNPFDVPVALVESQTRALAYDVAENLKKHQGFTDEMVQQALTAELDNLKARAESQVRASLILEVIASKEGIEVKPEDVDNEMKTVATNMKVDEARVREFYEKNPGRLEDLTFRMREDRAVKFLLEKAKIKDAK